MQQKITSEMDEDSAPDSFSIERKRRARVRQAHQRSLARTTSHDALNMWNHPAKKFA